MQAGGAAPAKTPALLRQTEAPKAYGNKNRCFCQNRRLYRGRSFGTDSSGGASLPSKKERQNAQRPVGGGGRAAEIRIDTQQRAKLWRCRGTLRLLPGAASAGGCKSRDRLSRKGSSKEQEPGRFAPRPLLCHTFLRLARPTCSGPRARAAACRAVHKSGSWDKKGCR
jgi:hypothetical protein